MNHLFLTKIAACSITAALRYNLALKKMQAAQKMQKNQKLSEGRVTRKFQSLKTNELNDLEQKDKDDIKKLLLLKRRMLHKL